MIKEQTKTIIKQYADKSIENFNKALKNEGKEATTTKFWEGFSECANLLLLEIDSLQEEPVNKDSEQAAADYENNMWKAGHPEDTYTSTDIIRAVKFGANWQKEQMIIQLENIVYRRYSLDGGSEQRNKDLIKLIQNWKCPDGV
jgi:hypothetical protein